MAIMLPVLDCLTSPRLPRIRVKRCLVRTAHRVGGAERHADIGLRVFPECSDRDGFGGVRLPRNLVLSSIFHLK
jgi:hypothetical protein